MTLEESINFYTFVTIVTTFAMFVFTFIPMRIESIKVKYSLIPTILMFLSTAILEIVQITLKVKGIK